MHKIKVAITGWGSLSPLGAQCPLIWDHYLNNRHFFSRIATQAGGVWGAPIAGNVQAIVSVISQHKRYRQLDPVVWYAIAASRLAVQQAGWIGDQTFGINIGSSRGATTAFEKYHAEFIESGRQKADPLTSPITTLGNIASWVAADLNSTGPAISHSVTCSSAMHAVANAVVWLTSGLCTRFIAGGSEACLTPFTLTQMKALKIYSTLFDEYPCRAMDPSKTRNTMIIGDGAASFCLEAAAHNAIAYITGLGYSTEIIKHGASVSADAICLQRSMRMALNGHALQSVDVVILHSPGTLQGDSSEMHAIEALFGSNKPLLTCNKWKIGHSLGASGALSIEMALLMLQHDRFIDVPYLPKQNQIRSLRKILVNATGFGGNAVSIVIEKA
jgi:3-oxoacyl-(acyl-carrier-protein) synthase